MATVETIGSDPSDDYSTIASWFSAHSGSDITADANAPYIGELRGGENHAGTSLHDVDTVTDSTHYFHLRPQSGAEFEGDFAKSNVATITSELTVTESYTRVEHLVFKSSSSITAVQLSGKAEDTFNVGTIIDSCGAWQVDRSTGQATSAAIFEIHSAASYPCDECVIRNCVIAHCSWETTEDSKSIRIKGIYAYAYEDCINYVLHNTIYGLEAITTTGGSFAYGIDLGGSTGHPTGDVYCKNNIVAGLTADTVTPIRVSGLPSSSNVTHNATDEASCSGSNNQTSITPADELTDLTESTFDAHLLSGGDCESNAGSLSGVSQAPSEDIDGDTIGDDIGCDTIVSGGTTYNESVSMGVSVNLTLGDVITFEGAITLAAQCDLTLGDQGTLYDTIALGSQLDILTSLGAASYDNAITLGGQLGVTLDDNLELMESISLVSDVDISVITLGEFEESLLLAADVDISAIALVEFQNAIVLGNQLDISVNSSGEFEESVSLATDVDISVNGLMGLEESISIGISLDISLEYLLGLYESVSFGAGLDVSVNSQGELQEDITLGSLLDIFVTTANVYDGAITLGCRTNITADNNGVFYSSISLPVQLDLSLIGTPIIDKAIALALEAGISVESLTEFAGAIALNIELGIQEQTQVILQDAITLGLIDEVTLEDQAILYDEIAFAVEQDLRPIPKGQISHVLVQMILDSMAISKFTSEGLNSSVFTSESMALPAFTSESLSLSNLTGESMGYSKFTNESVLVQE